MGKVFHTLGVFFPKMRIKRIFKISLRIAGIEKPRGINAPLSDYEISSIKYNLLSINGL
jgi:hypothetical protein